MHIAAERLPKLFIGSSSESLPLLGVLKEKLAGDAVITAWTDPKVFRPLDFYVDSLLAVPLLFDFGLFLFEPDDVVESRGVRADAPRDNVVFELGLFMSRLGLKRAFAMIPRRRVKVLSDIAGLELLQYDDPPGADDIRRKLRKCGPASRTRHALEQELQGKLAAAVEPTIEDIRTLLGAGVLDATGVFPDAPNVVHIAPSVMRLVKASVEITGSALVRHLALDMSEAWGLLANDLLHGTSKPQHVVWRCLMIDPSSPEIQRVASPSVSVELAASRIDMMRAFLREHAQYLRNRDVVFECRLYAHAPVMHGFHIDGSALLWSLCDIRQEPSEAGQPQWRLEGLKTPYWRFDAADDAIFASHPARAFKNWFDYRWNAARPAWEA